MADVKYKTMEIFANNKSSDIQKLKDARTKIRAYKKDSSLNIFNLLLSIGGLFNVGVGITSVLFDGTVSSRSAYLDECEYVYTTVIELLLEHDNGSSLSYIPYIKVNHILRGTYQGNNKGYVYKAQDVNYNVGKI